MAEKIIYEKNIVVVIDQEVTKFQSPDGYSIREWKLTIYAINDVGAKFQANFIEKVEYNLHPTFKNPTRIMKKAPFTIIEKGWGEFDMNIRLFFPDKSIDPWNIDFDLNFQKPHYEVIYNLTFTEPKPEFHRLLKKEIPVLHDSRISSVSSSSSAVKSKLKPGRPKRSSSTTTTKTTYPSARSSAMINNRISSTTTTPTTINTTTTNNRTQTPNRYKIDDSPNYESSSRSSYSSTDSAYDKENCLIDYTRLANNLSSLEGNDILEVIDLITRNRTNDMYINDDIDGEFHMDLYSLGEDLLKVLWDFTESRLSGRDP